MQLRNATILITGGTAGIGLQMATDLLTLGNTVIVTGRDPKKLEEAKKRLPNLHTLQGDVGNAQQVAALCERVVREFPRLNVLINNAGIMRKVDLCATDLSTLDQEIRINLTGTVLMVGHLLPHLLTMESAAIVNVSSGLAFVPMAISPIYSATKAAVHAYTQCLRIQLQATRVQVMELAPPGTETALFRGDFTPEDLGGVKGMAVQELSKKAIAGMQRGTPEIAPGLAKVLRFMSRAVPSVMLKQLGQSAKLMKRPPEAVARSVSKVGA